MVPSGDLQILILGKGAKEHALAKKLAESPTATKILVYPGNAGTKSTRNNKSSFASLKIYNVDMISNIVGFAKDSKICLVVPGDASFAIAGLGQKFQDAGIPFFAPSQVVATRLQGDLKSTYEFMKRHGIPAPDAHVVTSKTTAKRCLGEVFRDPHYRHQVQRARRGPRPKALVSKHTMPHIVKDGAKALFTNAGAVEEGLRHYVKHGEFACGTKEKILEEVVEGMEICVLTFSDGTGFISMPAAQVYKVRIPCAGGWQTSVVGCIAPAKDISSEDNIGVKHIIRKTLEGLRKDGTPYIGMLSTRIILTEGPKVLGYDVAGTAVETLTLMRLFKKDCDLAKLMLACIEGRLGQVSLQTEDRKHSCTVVLRDSIPEPLSSLSPKLILIDDKKLSEHDRDAIKFFNMDTKIFLDPKAKQSNTNDAPNTEMQARSSETYIQVSGRGAPRSLLRALHKEAIATGPRIIAMSALASSLNEAIHKAAFAAEHNVTYPGKLPMTYLACLAIFGHIPSHHLQQEAHHNRSHNRGEPSHREGSGMTPYSPGRSATSVRSSTSGRAVGSDDSSYDVRGVAAGGTVEDCGRAAEGDIGALSDRSAHSPNSDAERDVFTRFVRRVSEAADLGTPPKEEGTEVFVRAQMTAVTNPRVLSLQFGELDIGQCLRLPHGSTREPQILHPHSRSSDTSTATKPREH